MIKKMLLIFVFLLIFSGLVFGGILDTFFGGGSLPNPSGSKGGSENSGGTSGQGGIGSGQGIFGDTEGRGPREDVQNVEPCFETDQGQKYAVSGIATGKVARNGNELDYPDICSDAFTLIETSCNEWTGLVQFNKVLCSHGCQESAEGGSCPQAPYCIDTDKNENQRARGFLIMIKSATTALPRSSFAALAAGNNVELYRDSCVDTLTVEQYACTQNGLGYEVMQSSCSEGLTCKNGICGNFAVIIDSETSKATVGGLGPLGVLAGGNADDETHLGVKRTGILGGTPLESNEPIEIVAGGTALVNGVRVTVTNDLQTLSYTTQLPVGQQTIGYFTIDLEDDGSTPSTPSTLQTSISTRKLSSSLVKTKTSSDTSSESSSATSLSSTSFKLPF